jgi:formate dehydrogenase subunit delta
MRIERLIAMANDIANYFMVEPDHATAVNGIRDHLTRFWDPVMRRELKAYVSGGGEGLQPLALEAVNGMVLPSN